MDSKKIWSEEYMEFSDKEAVDCAVRAILEDLSVLQVKVGALESLLLKDDEARANYTRLVSAQAEALMRERKNNST